MHTFNNLWVNDILMSRQHTYTYNYILIYGGLDWIGLDTRLAATYLYLPHYLRFTVLVHLLLIDNAYFFWDLRCFYFGAFGLHFMLHKSIWVRRDLAIMMDYCFYVSFFFAIFRSISEDVM
ncbi:hypothetical protein BO71DRAFT_76380 [Aspergillus ellipticus CBS 707.79]|uniref:Uncharacterized protein n=1 Tax=Aspergillus ellipticus CBS 707.79 TaxID=1448320 RepID=A0A319D077_9EURO|nr:hypothetical protein BO71DRAFT_76380 [Aspergillus ellipticus CBS 707.79]